MYHEIWTVSCVLLVLGLLCAAVASVLKYYAEQKIRYSGRAEAKVVNIVTEPRSGNASLSEFRNRQAAVFEFYAGGKLIKVTDPADTYPCPYRMHQTVHICYNPENPTEFELMEKSRWKLAASVVNVLGITGILSGCGLFLLYASRIPL